MTTESLFSRIKLLHVKRIIQKYYIQSSVEKRTSFSYNAVIWTAASRVYWTGVLGCQDESYGVSLSCEDDVH